MLIHYSNSVSDRTYGFMKEAIASARRIVAEYVGFKSVKIYKITDGKKKMMGTVIHDPNYEYGNNAGIFYVPKGRMYDGYRASGINRDGSLNSKKYRLT